MKTAIVVFRYASLHLLPFLGLLMPILFPENEVFVPLGFGLAVISSLALGYIHGLNQTFKHIRS